MQNSSRLARPPERSYTKFGFGLGAVPHQLWKPRRAAVQRVHDIFHQRTPSERTDENLQSFAAVEELFSKINRENSFDWFSVSRLFGTPSGKLAGSIQKLLMDAAEALRRGAFRDFENLLNKLDREPFGDMLDAYLTATRPLSPQSLDEPYGWVGLVWSSSSANEIWVSSTASRVHALLPKDRDGDPFGLLAAWNVSDAHLAHEQLCELFSADVKLSPLTVRPRTDHLLGIKHRVEAALSCESLLCPSPWHEIRYRHRAQPRVSAPATTQNDLSERDLIADVDAIFSAFRR